MLSPALETQSQTQGNGSSDYHDSTLSRNPNGASKFFRPNPQEAANIKNQRHQAEALDSQSSNSTQPSSGTIPSANTSHTYIDSMSIDVQKSKYKHMDTKNDQA